MLLYNSLSGEKEEFHIPTDRPVTLYVCGVTPYDTTHVGHARTYLFFDFLVRYLRWKGSEIHYCQNVTDVDDPLFERAERDNIHWRDLAEQQVAQFIEDCDQLNMIRPTYFPRASEEITTMIPIIEQLVTLEHAYVREGNVYFSVKSDPTFAAMARMGYDELLETANQRGNNPNDPHKADPLDFVLWQTGKPGDPTWESPWGEGRPGWHIECSAMSTRYLGPQIDLHGGGSDLLFPHHSCEIAQTEPVTGRKPFSRFWLHTGMVYLDGEKMSKSLGNLVFIHKALQEHSANALRWYLLSVPYQAPFVYDRKQVIATEAKVLHLFEVLQLPSKPDAKSSLDITSLREAFDTALTDNLDTSRALSLLETMCMQVTEAVEKGQDVTSARHIIAELADLIGFR